MKKLRRLLIISFALTLGLAAAAGPAYGAVIKENNTGISLVQNLGAGSDGKTWMNPHYKTVPQYLFTIRTGGEEKYGYCFQTGKLFSDKYTYTAKRPANASAWTNLSAARQNVIRLVMFYGYNNGKSAPVSGANWRDYYAATQVLVWEAADGDISLSAGGTWSKSTNKHYNLIKGRTNAVKCYDWIKAEISKHVKGPSFGAASENKASTYKMKYDYGSGMWKAELNDSKGGNFYKAGSGTSSALNVSRQGYKYTFTTEKAGTKTCILVNNKSAGTQQPLMVFKPSHSGKQAIVIGATDATYFYAKFTTEKTGRAVITKTVSDGSSPEGFRFLIENSSNGYSKIHTTDESGQIELELYPGKYEVTEILTDQQIAEGFTSPAGGQMVVEEGRTAELNLENIRKQVPFRIVKTSDNDVVKGFEFAVTDEDGTEAFRGVTSADGTVEGQLYPGVYTVQEILSDEQQLDGYREAEPQKLKITSAMSAVQTVRMHNTWEPVGGGIIIRKTTDDGGPEDGFRFDVEGIAADSGEEIVFRDCVTDATGRFVTGEVPPGTYTITEKMTAAQAGRYQGVEPKTIEITEAGKGAFVCFENRAIYTEVTVNKTSEDGKVAGVQFAIEGKTEWGDEFHEVIRKTDENGQLVIRLQPGEYTITETGEQAGGYKVQPPRKLHITGGQKKETVDFVNIPNSFTMTKTETMENGMATNTPVSGAEYEVYRLEENDGNLVKVDYGRFTTDEDGKFTVKGVVPGEYWFSEVSAPNGYLKNTEPVRAVFREGDVNVEVSDTNRRAPGMVTIVIKDNQGNPVESTEMGIYLDSSCTEPVGTYVTDETGRIKTEELPWGDYYIREIRPTRGYEENRETKEVCIGKDGVTDFVYEILKEQKRGKVLLTKTDMSGDMRLEGAEFSLYMNDGTLVRQGLVTDENGQLLVEDLEWGGYYFRETKAPDGYGCGDNPVRFSVNATTGGILQKISVENEAETSSVIISKKILADDLHYAHGVPAFTFVLKGTGIDGKEREYVRQITFSREYVEENTDEEGFVTGSAVFGGLTAGEYSCREKDTLRYELETITDMSSNCVVPGAGGEAVFTLEGSDTGRALFVNRKTDWSGLSDSISLNNIINGEKKLTALAVEYTGPDMLDGNVVFDAENYLEVTAFYDDGSECALAPEEYTMLDGSGNTFGRVPKEPGVYTIEVVYSEGNLMRSGQFGFEVAAATELVVEFETDGGTELLPLDVWKYDCLGDYDSARWNTEKQGYRFTGWYRDADLAQAFTETDPVTESMTLYAGWEQKHLNDYSWEELKGISESGRAEELLGECFETVKADLSDDGMISAGSFEHMKAFDCGGTAVHAMIAGFDHDIRADGSMAGISFLVYEPAGNSAMITADTERDLGWASSDMRQQVLKEMYECLPDALKPVICAVQKQTATKASGKVTVETTEDYLWLPSQIELYGAWGYDTWGSEPSATGESDMGVLKSLAGEGAQYALYRDAVPDGLPGAEAALASGAAYWTRSLDPSLDRGFCFVDALGGAGSM